MAGGPGSYVFGDEERKELLDVMELLGSEGITNDLLIKKLDEMIVKVEMELGI